MASAVVLDLFKRQLGCCIDNHMSFWRGQKVDGGVKFDFDIKMLPSHNTSINQ